MTIAILAAWVRLASPSRAQLLLLFACLGYINEEGNSFNPTDIPQNADHFERQTRLLTPLLEVVEREITDERGRTTSTMGFSPAALLQRRLESPDAVSDTRAQTEGHVLTLGEREANGVAHDHVMPIATSPVGGRRRGFLHRKVAPASALVGLDFLRVGRCGSEEEIYVGDR